MAKKITTKNQKATEIKYEIDDDVAISSWSTFDVTLPEYIMMKNLKINQSFPFPESRKTFVENSRNHLQRVEKMHFAIRQERDKVTKAIVPGKYRIWHIDENTIRAYRRKGKDKKE